jgi:iron complex outermembrane receptor protein
MSQTAPWPVKAPVRPRFVIKASVLALAGAGLLSSASVWAQQAPAAEVAATAEASPAATPAPAVPASAEQPAPTNIVTVSGVRAAARSSQENKRKSDQVIDTIVAEDIGKFPDNNVAETLARVTGIQIRRDSGEASTVLIRGLPDISTLLNGRELFTTTGRYVSLADIPATMLQRVDVYKSQSADQLEGAVAGVVDVRTNRPFDFKDAQLSVNTRALYSDKSKSTDPQISGMASNRWKTSYGEFGALLGLSFQEQNYHEERAFQTAPVDHSSTQAGLTAPDTIGLIPIAGDRRRSALNTALQWRPNRDVEVYFEGLISRDKINSESDYFVALPWWTDGSGTTTVTTIPGTGQAQTINSQNAYTIASTQANASVSLTQQYALGGSWDITPQWRATSEAAYTRSKYDWRNPILDTVTVVPSASVNTNSNGSVNVNYTGIDLSDASNYYIKGFFDRYGQDKGSAADWRGDLAYTPDNDGFFKEISFGARFANHKAESIKSFEGNAEASDVTTGVYPYTRQNASTIAGLSCLSEPMAGNYGLTQWYTPCATTLLNDISAIRQAVTGTTDARGLDPGSYFKDVEKNSAVYVKAKSQFALGSLPVDGTFGLRLAHTKQTLQGYDTDNGVYTLNTKDNTSTDWLPSAAFKVNFRQDLIGRFTAGRTITRPGFSQLNPGIALVHSSETTQATGAGGNPNLKPVVADNFDSALEWYFAPTGSVTGTVFHHKFDGYIESRIAAETYGTTSYNVTRPYNTGNGYLQGLELGYQQFYDKLPGFLSGLGLQVNGTYMRGMTTNETTTRAITGVSRYSYNVVGLYELGGWSGRLAYNWRSKFVDTYDQGGPGYDLIVAPTKQLDGSIAYKINKHLTVTLDAVNILNTVFRDYWNNQAIYPRDSRTYDRTVGLALRWNN